MARGFRGWGYKDVINFLKEKGFSFFEEKAGSHEAWIRKDASGKEFVVEVNFIRGGDTYPPLTLLTMIKQSGIDRKEWREWIS